MYIPTGYAEGAMIRSTVFTSNRSQAVRLPKAVALPEGVRQVEIVRLGRSRLISPAGQSWDTFFEGPMVSDDFMRERQQPAEEPREPL
jgi:antitoxin VapB